MTAVIVLFSLAEVPPAGRGVQLPPGAVCRIGSPRLRFRPADVLPLFSRPSAFSPDGRYLLAGGRFVIDAHTGETLQRLPASATDSGFAPDGRLLIVGLAEAGTFTVTRIDPADGTGKVLFRKPLGRPAGSWPRLIAGGRAVFVRDGALGGATFAIPGGEPLARWVAPLESHLYGHSLQFAGGRALDRGQSVLLLDGAQSPAAGAKLTDSRIVSLRTGAVLALLPHRVDRRPRLSPDGRTVALSDDLIPGLDPREARPVTLFDAATGRRLGSIDCDVPAGVTFSPAGDVVTYSAGELRLVRRDGTPRRASAALPIPPSRLRVTPDGRQLLVWVAGRFQRWTLPGLRRTYDVPAVGQFLAVSPDSKTLAVVEGSLEFNKTTETAEVSLIDLPTGRVRLAPDPPGEIDLMRLLPGGRAVTVVQGREAAVWDAATGRRLNRYAPPDGFLVLDVGPGGRLAVSDWRDIFVLDTTTGRRVGGVKPLDRVGQVRFTAGGRLTGARADCAARSLEVVDWATRGDGGPRVRFSVPARDWRVVGPLSPDGRAVVRDWRGGIAIHTAGGCREIRTASLCREVTVFSPDGRLLAVAADHTTGPERFRFPDERSEAVSVYEAATGRRVVRLAQYHDIDGMGFAPDGRSLAVARAGRVVLHALPSGVAYHTIRRRDVGHKMAFSPAGRWLATYSGLAPAYIWRLPTRPPSSALERSR